MMNFEQINGQNWYLAQYITGGKNRERLFDWLSDQQITPWTPLTVKTIPRADKVNCVRKRISPLFPGYFFLKANLATQPVAQIRTHSAFCGFVMSGSQIAPMRPLVVEGLMMLHPDPTLCPEARDELQEASQKHLTAAQYHSLLRMEQDARPVSNVALLMQLVFEPGSLGF
ncbi:transcription termination/antitermination NusG family protein [Erwinia sp. LJJL01]|uniref:transcription termination/antitermination NusG family protein n=1 Tax=Erwinia sp. LJJL01 TaxID=3391839 RepID=UPI0039AF504D